MRLVRVGSAVAAAIGIGVGGCAVRPSDEGVGHAIPAFEAARRGDDAEAARRFADVWRAACRPGGVASEALRTHALQQGPAVRAAFLSSAGRRYAEELLAELAGRCATAEPNPEAVVGFVRLAHVLGRSDAVASAVERRRDTGLNPVALRPGRRLLATSGRPDLADLVEPSRGARALECVGGAVRDAGIVVVGAPIVVPFALIAWGANVDDTVATRGVAWPDPIDPADL